MNGGEYHVKKVGIPVLAVLLALSIAMPAAFAEDTVLRVMVLRDTNIQTLPLMLSYMKGDPTRGTNLGALMLASTLAVLPLLVAFLSATKFFMNGLTAGAIKE